MFEDSTHFGKKSTYHMIGLNAITYSLVNPRSPYGTTLVDRICFEAFLCAQVSRAERCTHYTALPTRKASKGI